MATNIETMWVGDAEQLQRTVQNLVQRGGVVQAQSDTEVTLFIKKKMNVVVLVVGLILCLVPGLAYLIWYTTADQSQQITVKIGSPETIKTDHQHWYDSDGTPRPDGGVSDAPTTDAPATPSLGTADPYQAVPPMPAAPEPAPAYQPPPAAYEPPPAPPAPPAYEPPPAPPAPPAPPPPSSF